MPATPLAAYPYPDPDALLRDYPLHLQALAQKVEDVGGAGGKGFVQVTPAADWRDDSGIGLWARDLGNGWGCLVAGRVVRTANLGTSPGNGYTFANLPASLRPYSTQYGAGLHGIAGNLGGCPLMFGADGAIQFISFLAAGTMASYSGATDWQNGVVWSTQFFRTSAPAVGKL